MVNLTLPCTQLTVTPLELSRRSWEYLALRFNGRFRGGPGLAGFTEANKNDGSGR